MISEQFLLEFTQIFVLIRAVILLATMVLVPLFGCLALFYFLWRKRQK